MEEEEREWRRIMQIRELDNEELQVEEVDVSSSEDETSPANEFENYIYSSYLVSMESYFNDDVNCDMNQSLTCLDAGPVVNLPMFYTQVVLFPEAVLSMRVAMRRFIASLGKAFKQAAAPCTLGVVYVYKDPYSLTLRFSSVGTTAEIQQYCLLEDGSYKVVIRGKQRFHLRHHWIDEEGAPCADVQFIHEELPSKTPRDVFGEFAPVTNFWNCSSVCQVTPDDFTAGHGGNLQNNDSESSSETSFENSLAPAELQMHRLAIKFCKSYDRSDVSVSTYSSSSVCESENGSLGSCDYASGGSSENSHDVWSRNSSVGSGNHYKRVLEGKSDNDAGFKLLLDAHSKSSQRASRSFWPHWVYRMYDSYYLAEKATVMWKQIIGDASLGDLAKKPDSLSFLIASKMPVSEYLRQELLEVNGVSYRLRREIEILESFDLVHCKTCQSATARRSELLSMSSDGPLGANANTVNYVHETKAFCQVTGVTLTGCPSEECSWFPGYAWTVATCTVCKSVMGWLFTAVDHRMKPDSFWIIRTSQIAETFTVM